MPGWWGCTQAPWNTNRHLRTQETAPYPAAELPKRLQGPQLDLEELGGAWAAAPHGGGCEARSSSEGALAEEEDPCGEGKGDLGPAQRGSGGGTAEAAVWLGGGIQQRRHWSTGRQDTAEDLASPWDRQSPGRPTTARPLLPITEQISVPALAPKILQMESSIVTVGAESRASELPASLGWFLLWPHGLNNPH